MFKRTGRVFSLTVERDGTLRRLSFRTRVLI